MRVVKKIMFVIETDNPTLSLALIVAAGCSENDYTPEEFEINSEADSYVRIKKD